jgi:hypothetical protein
MADEKTVPLLPCASIDDVAAFYEVLGFRTTYRQRKPNPAVGLQREDIGLQFFEIEGFDPADSYGSCLVVTPDLEGLHGAFTAGMRAAYGKVLVSGIPRMTRPRKRKNYDGLSGFSVIDPGGNWIRVVRKPGGPEAEREAGPEPAVGALGKALANAVVQADSRGNVEQAVRILDTALGKPDAAADPATLVEVLVYRAELATVLGDRGTAADLVARATGLGMTPEQAEHAADLVQPPPDPSASRG